MKPIKGVVMSEGLVTTESGLLINANTSDIHVGDDIQIHFDFEGAKVTKLEKKDVNAEINEIDENPPEYLEY